MIIADFFETKEKLDEFILSIRTNQIARISNDQLKLFQYNLIDTSGNCFGDKRLIKVINFPMKEIESKPNNKPSRKRH